MALHKATGIGWSDLLRTTRGDRRMLTEAAKQLAPKDE